MIRSHFNGTTAHRRRTVLAAVAATVGVGLIAAAPAAAQISLGSGSYGRYNCELNPGGGVYVVHGTSNTYTDGQGRLHTISCNNGVLTDTVAR